MKPLDRQVEMSAYVRRRVRNIKKCQCLLHEPDRLMCCLNIPCHKHPPGDASGASAHTRSYANCVVRAITRR